MRRWLILDVERVLLGREWWKPPRPESSRTPGPDQAVPGSSRPAPARLLTTHSDPPCARNLGKRTCRKASPPQLDPRRSRRTDADRSRLLKTYRSPCVRARVDTSMADGGSGSPCASGKRSRARLGKSAPEACRRAAGSMMARSPDMTCGSRMGHELRVAMALMISRSAALVSRRRSAEFRFRCLRGRSSRVRSWPPRPASFERRVRPIR